MPHACHVPILSVNIAKSRYFQWNSVIIIVSSEVHSMNCTSMKSNYVNNVRVNMILRVFGGTNIIA